MLECQKSKFSLPEDVVYLNGSYMSPNLKRVEKAGIWGVKRKSQPFRISPDDFFSMNNEVRRTYSELIKADQPGRIVLIPSVSYGISSAANNIPLQKGDKILLTGEQFPSNVYPWLTRASQTGAKVEFVEPPASTQNRGRGWNHKILNAIDKRTKVVAVPQVHWTDGTLFDLMSIRDRTNDVGAYLVIDATQTAGAYPFDVNSIRPDALVVAAYKWLLGPYSLGLAYYGPAFDNGIPLEENWMNRLGSQNFSGLVNYQEVYQPLSNRFEVGERSNFVLLPMLLESLKQLNEWNPSRIQEYCQSLSFPYADRFREKGCWIEEDAYRTGHIFGIRLPEGVDFEKIKRTISGSGIYVSVRGSSIRVSPNVYNTSGDLEKLLHCFNF